MHVEKPHVGETGLDLVRRLCHPGEGGQSFYPIADLLGMSAVSVERGEVVFELTPHAKHYAIISVHGGWRPR